MSRTYRLRRSQLVRRPRDEVFAFFADAGNLEQLTPASLGFRIVSPHPIALQAGAVIEYRLRLHGLPMRWRSVIELYEPPLQFVDVQTRGPYRRWRHTHRFLDHPDGTLVEDEVEYQLPLGPLGQIADALFVRRSLQRIFDYRRQRLVELFA